TMLYVFDDTAEWCLRSRYVFQVLDRAQAASRSLLEAGNMSAYNRALEAITPLLEGMAKKKFDNARSEYNTMWPQAYESQKNVLGYLDYSVVVNWHDSSGVLQLDAGEALQLDTLMRLNWSPASES